MRKNVRFLRHDSGLGPVFGRLTHIGAPPPRATLILFEQVGYRHLLSREALQNYQQKPFKFLQDVQMAFHIIQQ